MQYVRYSERVYKTSSSFFYINSLQTAFCYFKFKLWDTLVLRDRRCTAGVCETLG